MRRAATAPEHRLWRALRGDALGGLKFRRQQPIGHFIADFYCPAAKLVVEVDGWTHTDAGTDLRRDTWMGEQGIRVLRFNNTEVMANLEGVLAAILAAALTPPPTPSLKGRGLSSSRRLEGQAERAAPPAESLAP